jgi:hypothetical protein
LSASSAASASGDRRTAVARPSAVASIAIAVSSAVYVFVAATARSSPARRSMQASATRASGESGVLVMAIVGAPMRRAASTTATTSGDAPDWLIPSTAERR